MSTEKALRLFSEFQRCRARVLEKYPTEMVLGIEADLSADGRDRILCIFEILDSDVYSYGIKKADRGLS